MNKMIIAFSCMFMSIQLLGAAAAADTKGRLGSKSNPARIDTPAQRALLAQRVLTGCRISKCPLYIERTKRNGEKIVLQYTWEKDSASGYKKHYRCQINHDDSMWSQKFDGAYEHRIDFCEVICASGGKVFNEQFLGTEKKPASFLSTNLSAKRVLQCAALCVLYKSVVTINTLYAAAVNATGLSAPF